MAHSPHHHHPSYHRRQIDDHRNTVEQPAPRRVVHARPRPTPGALLEYVAKWKALDENAMAPLLPTAMEPLESASPGDSKPATDAAP